MRTIFLKISKKWMEIKQTAVQKAKVWYYIILLLIPILVVLGIYKYWAYQTDLLRENDGYTNAVVDQFLRCYGEDGPGFCYKYTVDGAEYRRCGKRFPNSDTLSEGDTIIIKYYKEFPANTSRHLRN